MHLPIQQRTNDDLTPAIKENYSLTDLKKAWMASDKHHRTVFISAKTKENVEELRDLLYEEVKKIHIKRYPSSRTTFTGLSNNRLSELYSLRTEGILKTTKGKIQDTS